MRIALPPILPVALAGHDPAAAVIDLAGETMGTTWRVRYAGRADGGLRAAIEARLAGLVAEMSHWAPGSLLSRFNRSPAGTWTMLPPDFAHVMADGLAIADATGGAFDPTIGRLVDLWGFGPDGNVSRFHPSSPSASFPSPVGRGKEREARKGEGDRGCSATPLPSQAAIDLASAVSGYRRVAYEPAGRYIRQPGGIALDLSGIAKGHAVDAVADLMTTRGIAHCLVEIGGELVGRGIRPDGDPWWVDLEAPPGIAVEPLRIALHGIAVATSGDYRRGAHTLDPRTGQPITNGVVSASVVHATALAADAWATALTVLGAADGLDLADREGIAGRIVTVIGGRAREHITPALAAMLVD